MARGKIFGIKGQPVVKSIYIQAPMNYFFNKTQTSPVVFVNLSTNYILFID